ncbi:MAG: hypothetical protein QM820_07655 [Minicystis sp.]
MRGELRIAIRDEDDRVVEACQQRSAAPQHTMALAPDGADIRHVEVGDRVEDDVERRVRQGRQVAHVALDRAQGEPVARGDHAVLIELRG